jgi:hypothetical protein
VSDSQKAALLLVYKNPVAPNATFPRNLSNRHPQTSFGCFLVSDQLHLKPLVVLKSRFGQDILPLHFVLLTTSKQRSYPFYDINHFA